MRAPHDVVTRWQAAWNAGDADAIAQLFAPEAEFVNVVGLWWHLSGQVSPAGESAGGREGIFVFVLERRDHKWIVVAAQNTDVVAGAQTHIVSDGGRSSIHYERPT